MKKKSKRRRYREIDKAQSKAEDAWAKKRRSIASYRAASLKGARSKRRMKQFQFEISRDFVEITRPFFNPLGGALDDMLPPEKTINRIPKVEWK